LFLYNRSSSFLGLDIGSSLIKVVQLKKNRKDVILSRYGVVKTPVGAVIDGKIQKPEQLAGSLKTLINRKTFKGKPTVISVGRENVILRSLVLPQMKRKELLKAMRYEVQKHITSSLEEITYDYSKLRCLNGNQVEILIAAVPQDIIQRYMEVMEMAGLYVSAVEVEALALIRNFGFDLNKRNHFPEDIVILLDVGAETTGMNVLEGNHYSFSRNLSLGSNYFIRKVMEKENISQELAEHKLNNHTFLGLRGAEDAAAELVREVQRTLNYYLYRNDDREMSLKKIFITGGASGFTGLDSYISSKLQIETLLFDPFLYLECDKKISNNIYRDKRFLNVAIGLALRRWNRNAH